MSLDTEGRLTLQADEAELTAAVCSCIDGIISIACSLPRPLSTRSYAHMFDNKPASVPLEAIIRQLSLSLPVVILLASFMQLMEACKKI